MRCFFRKRYAAGFTLVEVLIVVAIIGMLAGSVLASATSARAKARDARRKADLNQVRLALELYHSTYDSYYVAGTGYQDCGCGWFNYEDGINYFVSVARGLWEEEFLITPTVEDPMQNPGYMVYLCDNDEAYALSATLENPSAADIDLIQRTCNGTGANGTYTVYGKNYAVANRAY